MIGRENVAIAVFSFCLMQINRGQMYTEMYTNVTEGGIHHSCTPLDDTVLSGI